MCIIVDANLQGLFMDRHADMLPVHDWIKKKGGKIAHSYTPKFQEETTKLFRIELRNLRRRGRLKLIASKDVQKQQNTLPNLQSDDPHIIALALAAKVKVLITHDKELEKDFKRHVRGSIYHNKTHKHLLKKDLCP